MLVPAARIFPSSRSFWRVSWIAPVSAAEPGQDVEIQVIRTQGPERLLYTLTHHRAGVGHAEGGHDVTLAVASQELSERRGDGPEARGPGPEPHPALGRVVDIRRLQTVVS
jgi:hypothetical protein